MRVPKSTIVIFVLAALLIASIALIVANAASAGDEYVRGKYGIRCYVKGQQHAGINPETMLTFPTLELCVQSFSD